MFQIFYWLVRWSWSNQWVTACLFLIGHFGKIFLLFHLLVVEIYRGLVFRSGLRFVRCIVCRKIFRHFWGLDQVIIHSMQLFGLVWTNLLSLILGRFSCSTCTTCLYNVLFPNIPFSCQTYRRLRVAFPPLGLGGMAHSCFLGLLDDLWDFLLVLAHQGRFICYSFARGSHMGLLVARRGPVRFLSWGRSSEGVHDGCAAAHARDVDRGATHPSRGSLRVTSWHWQATGIRGTYTNLGRSLGRVSRVAWVAPLVLVSWMVASSTLLRVAVGGYQLRMGTRTC